MTQNPEIITNQECLFDNYFYAESQNNQRIITEQFDNLDYGVCLNDDLFKYIKYPFNFKLFDNDQEVEQQHIIVKTPKQLPLDFQRELFHHLPIISLNNKQDIRDQQIQQQGRTEVIVNLESANNKIFNTMPGQAITAIQSFADDIQYVGIEQTNLRIMAKAKIVFQLLKQQVLKEIKCKGKTKEQLRSLLNNVDASLNAKIRAKKNLSKAQKNYLKILDEFEEQIINAAKSEFRRVIAHYLNNDWIFNYAVNQFKPEEKLKQIVLEKYLKNVKFQLIEDKEISAIVDRNRILKFHSLIQEQ